MTKSNCHYYNWGGSLDDDTRPIYPTEYGARCEFFKEFFVKRKSTIGPNCNKCKHYKKRKGGL